MAQKIFESKDFEKNKDRNIFSSKDFDKDKPTVPKSSNQKKWWIIATAIIVIGLIGYWGFSKPDNVAEETSSAEVDEGVVSEHPTTTSELEKDNIADENTADTDATTPSENIIGGQVEAQQNPDAESHTSETMKPSSTSLDNSNVSNNVEAEAMKVIRGDYGIGQERKNKLGAKYQTIQNRVNELKREGVF